MARVPLVDENTSPKLAALAAKIRGARGGTLHDFYRALMHSPDLAEAWFDFNNAVRFRTGLDDRLREIVIMRVAALTGCDYVWKVHEARYAAGAGLSRDEVAALRGPTSAGILMPGEQALLAYVDAMTRNVAVPDATYRSLRGHFGEAEIVELTLLVAAYNMQVRFLRALDIKPENRDK